MDDSHTPELGSFLERQSPPLPISKALVCGFRPATVALCELLITNNQGIRVNLLVSNEEQATRAKAELDDYHTGTGTFARHFEGLTGRFQDHGDNLFRLISDANGDELGSVQIRVGDWTDHSELVALPFEANHVGEHQLVVLMEESGRDSDGRTALAMLKMASLELGQRERFDEAFQLVAVVNDEPLGLRLQERYVAALPERAHNVQVLSSRSFRSYCMFQAAVVPGFAAIYSHLLGPTGCNFLPLVPREGLGDMLDTETNYAALSGSLRSRGFTLIGLQLNHVENGTKIVTCPEPGGVGDRFTVGQIHTGGLPNKQSLSKDPELTLVSQVDNQKTFACTRRGWQLREGQG